MIRAFNALSTTVVNSLAALKSINRDALATGAMASNWARINEASYLGFAGNNGL